MSEKTAGGAMTTRVVALDVFYRDTNARAAAVLFNDWSAPSPVETAVHETTAPAQAYQPGELYKRELPALLAVLERLSAPVATQVLRAESVRPLFVTAVGVDEDQARAWIHAMHGPHRLPTLLKLADTLSRGRAGAAEPDARRL